VGADARGLVARLERHALRPALFAPHSAPFWDDPHISRQLLAAHIDPHTDAASRRPDTIDRSVAWLANRLDLPRGGHVLDLGCGPGLYSERLAALGLSVTGVDISRTSLTYARRRARELGLRITYRHQDYLALRDRSRYDVALLIYFDFGVLADTERDGLLGWIHRALRPGGVFVFDVRAAGWQTDAERGATWTVHESGFWRPGPYLELTKHFDYADADVHLRQTLIVDTDGRITAYRFWDRAYSPKTIARVLEGSGFRVEELWADLAGASYCPDAPAFAVCARKV
jgi:SAM-dependent methyltransferase